jgi:flagellin-like protein
MKGISAVIATILMLLITIALAGTSYLYISGVFTSKTSVSLAIDPTSSCTASVFTVAVRNDGTGVASNVQIDVTLPDGTSMPTICSIAKINAGSTNSTACPVSGGGSGLYEVRAYGNGATASGPIYCGSQISRTTTTTSTTTSSSVTTSTTTTSSTTSTTTTTIIGAANLVGYWKFDDNGGSSAADSSGNGNPGTLVNSPTWVNGKYGYALNFNGGNQYVTVSSNDALSPEVSTGEMTLCAWINLESYPVSGQSRAPVIEKGSSGMWEYALYVYSSGAGGISVWTSSGNGVAEPQGGNIPLNTWTFLCGSYTSSSAVVYINGASIGSTVPSGTASANTAPVLIGARTDGSQYLNAIIDDARIYNRALSQTEINDLYLS